MRRIVLMFTVAALAAAMIVVGALPAFALNPQPIPPGRSIYIDRSTPGIQVVTTPSGNMLINDHFHPPAPIHPPSPCHDEVCFPGGGLD